MAGIVTAYIAERKRALAAKLQAMRDDVENDPILQASMTQAAYDSLISQLGLCSASLVMKKNPWEQK